MRLRAPLALVLTALPLVSRAAEPTPAVLPTVALSLFGGHESWPIAPGQVRRHQIDLQPGEFVRATVVQEGVDVVVRVVSAEQVPSMGDVSEGGRGREPASILATSPGRYALEVEAQAPGRGPAAYRLSYEPARIATDRDREWMTAERAIREAGESLCGRVADTKRRAPTQVEIRSFTGRFAEALPVARAHGETCWQAEITTHLDMARAWDEFMEPEHQLEYTPLLDLWQTCGDDARFVETILWAARWEQIRNRFEDAASVFDLGLRLTRERGDDPYLELQMLVGFANVRGVLGDTRGSIALLEEALPVLRALRIPAGEAVALEGMGRAHSMLGELQRAAELVASAVRIRRELGDDLGAYRGLLLLGEIHERQGDLDSALLDYDAAGKIVGPLSEHYQMAAAAASATVLRQLGRRAEAIDRLQDLFRLLDAAPSLFWQPSWPYVSLGELHADEGRWDLALREADTAVAHVQTKGDRYAWAQALDLRGRARLETGSPTSARDDFTHALALRRAIGDRIGEATSLHGLARVARQEGDPDGAKARLEEARAIVRTQRTALTSPQLRATWTATVRRIDEDYIELLMSGAKPDAEAAFDASEAAHARSLLDMLGESRAGTADGADTGLRDEESVTRRKLAERLDQQMRAPAGADEALKAEVRALASEHQRLRAELRAKHPRYAAFADPAPADLAAVQGGLLDEDTSLVEYFLGRDKSYAWVVTGDEVRSFELPGRARIDEAVDTMRRALAPTPRAPRTARVDAALREVSRLVWTPLAGSLSRRRLLVVPDGSLHHVPFGALTTVGGVALIDRWEVAIAPSASVVAFQRAEARERPRPTRDVAVIADPVYEAGDERVRAAPNAAAPRPASLERVTRDFGFRDGHLPRLAFTRREARAIMAAAPAETSRASLDFAASLATVRDPELGSYRYLHFATHGLLNDARPELSGIVLSLVDRNGRDQLGLLTAPDVLELRLGADLVVLSSCRSALGREVNGEGMLGLTGAFMYAGAPRVLASLWPVDDLATAELMKRFYRGLLGPERLSPAAALRAAQRDLRRQPQWRAPFYWAGFQLQGDWR